MKILDVLCHIKIIEDINQKIFLCGLITLLNDYSGAERNIHF